MINKGKEIIKEIIEMFWLKGPMSSVYSRNSHIDIF